MVALFSSFAAGCNAGESIFWVGGGEANLYVVELVLLCVASLLVS